ncbi:hypothetical protein J2T02_002428 [Chitinophaga terrae (ex Kim and Jung 2007)]|nr:hypothetical protein [Chitinophaga terrae (ex Kim and Jung 2007)]
MEILYVDKVPGSPGWYTTHVVVGLYVNTNPGLG